LISVVDALVESGSGHEIIEPVCGARLFAVIEECRMHRALQADVRLRGGVVRVLLGAPVGGHQRDWRGTAGGHGRGRRPQERSETQAQDEPDADACANGAGGEKTCETNHETTLLTSGQCRKWALPTRQPPEIGIVTARGRRSAMAA